jgi:2-haloacid dehalogenase
VGLEIILFDADRTLFDYDKAENAALKDTFFHFKFDYKADIHLALYREINEGLWRKVEKGEITPGELSDERFRRMFNKRLSEFDIKEFSRLYLINLSKKSFLIHGAEEICRSLSERFRLAIVTNGYRKVQLGRMEGSAIKPFIEKIIVSEDVGYNKPHPGIFQYTFDALCHNDKDTVLMVGDSLASDIAGGIRFGIKTCWYNPDRKSVIPGLEPDYEITDLRELQTLPEVSGEVSGGRGY